MAKTLTKFGPYNIVADTNALFTPDLAKLVSGGFTDALAELREHAAVHLYIPDVVLGELAFQRFQIAAAAIETIRNKLDTLKEIAGVDPPTICSLKRAKARIIKQYDNWCKSINANRFAVKVRQSAFNKIVQDAIWRNAPFEMSKDGKHEKGFRDRVVLEAVVQICSKSGNETILLTGDELLRKAVTDCRAKNLVAHPKLADFTSRIRLLREKEMTEWVNALFEAATHEFYTEDQPNCIYLRDKIYDQIVSRVADLAPPNENTGIFETKGWERQTHEQITLGTTQWDKREEGRFYWKSELKSAAVFSGRGFLNVPIENIRVSLFSIRWSSEFTDSAEITDSKFEGIDLISKQLMADTSEARTELSLPAKPVSGISTLPSLPNYLSFLRQPGTPESGIK